MPHDFDEDDTCSTTPNISVNGEYLWVEEGQNARSIYRRAVAEAQLHPCTARTMHQGQLYSLAWIEEDE